MDFEVIEVGIETHRIDRKDSIKVGVKKDKENALSEYRKEFKQHRGKQQGQ